MRLCFAVEINKAQGQIICNFGFYLPHAIFSHGKWYVVLSRRLYSEDKGYVDGQKR